MPARAQASFMEYKPYEPEHISVENEKYKVTNVKPLSTASEKSAALHVNMPAKAVWCYFGMDENDMVNHIIHMPIIQSGQQMM